MARQVINVTAALILQNGKYLIAQRDSPAHLAGKWEFPGGKIKAGEDERACLVRELGEELGVSAEVCNPFGVYAHDYGEAVGIVRLFVYCCRILVGEPQPLAHRELRWATPQEMLTYEFADADAPVVGDVLGIAAEGSMGNQR